MRVVIVGASGSSGTALLRRLMPEPDLDLVGVCRRPPAPAGPYAGVTWHSADIGADNAASRLAEVFTGADAVVHLAWQIQPSQNQRRLYLTNVLGSRAVFRAAVRAGVPTLVHASSVAVYAPGPKQAFVRETWLRTGVPESSYSRHKALVERMLDEIESDHPTMRIVRLRPGLIFQRDAGTTIARYFAGPLLPANLFRAGRIPVVPSHPGLRVQAVHADDVAEACLRILRTDLRGAVNLAAGPVLDSDIVGRVFQGVPLRVPGLLLAGAAALTWQLRLQPIDHGWVRLILKAPLMSCDRAAAELGWRPRTDAISALRELLTGMAESERTDPRGPIRGRTGRP